MDVATDQLDALIERRASREPDPDELEPSYAESVRRFHTRRREAHKWEWVRYFDRLARNHARLARENEARAAALIEEVG
jgi:8-oxo-dGTP pyrophosphatase MutT (NUDIX family)